MTAKKFGGPPTNETPSRLLADLTLLASRTIAPGLPRDASLALRGDSGPSHLLERKPQKAVQHYKIGSAARGRGVIRTRSLAWFALASLPVLGLRFAVLNTLVGPVAIICLLLTSDETNPRATRAGSSWPLLTFTAYKTQSGFRGPPTPSSGRRGAREGRESRRANQVRRTQADARESSMLGHTSEEATKHYTHISDKPSSRQLN